MHDQLSVPIDRKLQNSLILSMKSSIEERIRQASIVILQFLYTKFHQDHHEQQSQRRRASLASLDVPTGTSPTETNLSTEKPSTLNGNASVKVSALVAHYSNGESNSTTTNNVDPLSFIIE